MSRFSFPLLAALPVLALAVFGCSGNDNPVGNRDSNDDGADESGLRAVIVANPLSVPAGDDHATIVTISASDSFDPEGAELTFAWTVQLGTFVNGTDSNDETIQVTFPGITPYAVNLVVTDPDGNADSASMTIALDGEGGTYDDQDDTY